MRPSEFEKSLKRLYESESPEVLFSRLAVLGCPRRELIRSLIVTSQFRVSDLLPSLTEPGYKISVLRREKRLCLLALEHRSGRTERKTLKGSFFVVQLDLPYTYLLVAVSGWPFWSRALIPLIGRCHPKIVRVFLSQAELYGLFKNVRGMGDDVSIRIIKISSRRRLRIKGAKRRFETDVLWTYKPLETAFRQAAEENIWFKSVTFELVRQKGMDFQSLGVEASISKYGSVFSNSFFGGFLKTAIIPMAELASEKMGFYMGRERKSAPELPPRPIVILFPTQLFRSVDDARRFILVMRKMKNASCTVLHGNPYVHVSLVDNLDGSSAHLWVLKPDEVTIIPQIKTSEGALKRIVNHVFEEWGEGNVMEARG